LNFFPVTGYVAAGLSRPLEPTIHEFKLAGGWSFRQARHVQQLASIILPVHGCCHNVPRIEVAQAKDD